MFDLDLQITHPPLSEAAAGLGIGCIGAGFIMADCQIPSYLAAGLNVVGIFNRSRPRAEEVATRHGLSTVHDSLESLLDDERIEVLDLAVPPDQQLALLHRIAEHDRRPKAILAQKPLAGNLADAVEAVAICEAAGITLAVNQNMRYDQSIRACRTLLDRGLLGTPVTATIDMRAIPHWMPWQAEQGWCTLRIMSIHHLDTFRYLFGNPSRILCSTRPDPRTTFAHTDGICFYLLEYDDGPLCSAWDDVWAGPAREGAAGDNRIQWRVEGTAGLAVGTIGWPDYPDGSPSTIDFSLLAQPGYWLRPRWSLRWFPDAFWGTMAELLDAVSRGLRPSLSGRDNLHTMALVEAAYQSAAKHTAVAPADLLAAYGL